MKRQRSPEEHDNVSTGHYANELFNQPGWKHWYRRRMMAIFQEWSLISLRAIVGDDVEVNSPLSIEIDILIEEPPINDQSSNDPEMVSQSTMESATVTDNHLLGNGHELRTSALEQSYVINKRSEHVAVPTQITMPVRTRPRVYWHNFFMSENDSRPVLPFEGKFGDVPGVQAQFNRIRTTGTRGPTSALRMTSKIQPCTVMPFCDFAVKFYAQSWDAKILQNFQFTEAQIEWGLGDKIIAEVIFPISTNVTYIDTQLKNLAEHIKTLRYNPNRDYFISSVLSRAFGVEAYVAGRYNTHTTQCFHCVYDKWKMLDFCSPPIRSIHAQMQYHRVQLQQIISELYTIKLQAYRSVTDGLFVPYNFDKVEAVEDSS